MFLTMMKKQTISNVEELKVLQDENDLIIEKLKKFKIHTRLMELSKKQQAVKELCVIVENGVCYAVQRVKTIIRYMDEYTLHDETHLFRVLEHMENIILDDVINMMSPLELALLILSAFYHDIGMAPSERQVKIYKMLITKDEELEPAELMVLKEFQSYCKSNPQLQKRIEVAKNNKDFGRATLLENHRVTEYIRTNHAKNIKSIIRHIEENEKWAMGLTYKEFEFGKYLAKICESHNEPILELKNNLIHTSIPVASSEYMNTLFTCIVLRLADLFDFDAKRTPKVLFEHLDVRDPISLREWQKHRAVNAWNIGPERIMFSAQCEHPVIEKAIRDFCSYIESELNACELALKKMHDLCRPNIGMMYNLDLPSKVDVSNIKAKNDYDGNPLYYYRDLNFSLDQTRIVNLLMGTSLYGNSAVTLRELLQNAIDACRVRVLFEKNGETIMNRK